MPGFLDRFKKVTPIVEQPTNGEGLGKQESGVVLENKENSMMIMTTDQLLEVDPSKLNPAEKKAYGEALHAKLDETKDKTELTNDEVLGNSSEGEKNTDLLKKLELLNTLSEKKGEVSQETFQNLGVAEKNVKLIAGLSEASVKHNLDSDPAKKEIVSQNMNDAIHWGIMIASGISMAVGLTESVKLHADRLLDSLADAQHVAYSSPVALAAILGVVSTVVFLAANFSMFVIQPYLKEEREKTITSDKKNNRASKQGERIPA